MSENSGGIMGVKIKIMPTSPSVNLKTIEETAKKLVEHEKGRNREYIIEPIAFGLKAVIAFFEWPEEAPLERLEKRFMAIKDVSSIDIIDMRKIA
ncbi:elongation factor 1-beta [Candidatus Pacearchaeota archaeon]|nr:elongation factor 1-beta [Candidatus Pacearchaeota archaeon]